MPGTVPMSNLFDRYNLMRVGTFILPLYHVSIPLCCCWEREFRDTR